MIDDQIYPDPRIDAGRIPFHSYHGAPKSGQIYNAGNGELDLTDYTATDTPDDATTQQKFPAGKKIPAGGYMVFQLKDIDFGFNFKSTESLAIYDAKGKEIDKVSWTSLPDGESYGRLPDGGDTLQNFATPTPNAKNQ